MAEVRSEQGQASGRLTGYAALTRMLLLKSYRSRVLLAVFVGMHVPLISLVIYFALGPPVGDGSALANLAVAIAATLLGTAATLYMLDTLLALLSVVSRALRDYVESGVRPEFPADLSDPTGKLISDIQYTVDQVERINQAIHTLEEISVRDYLTGAYNRRGCEERLEEDLARVRRGGGILTLAVLDVDHFKRINDNYGHQAGDTCLKYVAGIIERNIRRGDWHARWGGDEFVVALWDAEPGSSAGVLLNRIENALKRNPVRLGEGIEIHLTLSGGAYRCGADEDGCRCFGLADEALRRAKREGRGRMVYSV